MLTKRIIPCLDIKDGRTVKGVNFVDLRDAGDPVELAKKYGIDAHKDDTDSMVMTKILAKKEFGVLNEYNGAAALLWVYLDEPTKLYYYKGESKSTETDKVETNERPLFKMRTREGIYFSSIASSLKNVALNGVEIECLPGATAFVPALVNSGLPNDKFVFEGFLPHKKGRQTRWKAIAEEERTTVLYESPHRLHKALEQIIEFIGPDRPIMVARELSKMHEQLVRGTSTEVLLYFVKNPDKIRGEIVIVIAGK